MQGGLLNLVRFREEMLERVGLVVALGRVSPQLEALDLQNRAYGKDITFAVPQELMSSDVSDSYFLNKVAGS